MRTDDLRTPLTKKDLVSLLSKMPDDAMIYIKSGSDAYPAIFRAFQSQNGDKVIYFEEEGLNGWHRNHPCGSGKTIVYHGTKELSVTG